MKAAARSSMAWAAPAEEGQRAGGGPSPSGGRCGAGVAGPPVRSPCRGGTGGDGAAAAGAGASAARRRRPREEGPGRPPLRRPIGCRGGARVPAPPLAGGRGAGARGLAERRGWARGLGPAALPGSGTEPKGGGKREPLPARRSAPYGTVAALRSRSLWSLVVAASPGGTEERPRSGEPGRGGSTTGRAA